MLSNEMPDCLCGVRGWRPGGGSMGPSGSFEWFVCESCDRRALSVYFDGAVVLMAHVAGQDFTKPEIGFVNGPLMTSLRFRHERLEEAREVVANRYWDEACDAIGVPRGTTYDGVPAEKRKAWHDAYRYDADPEWKRPAGFGERFIPPQVPATLAAFTLQRNRATRWTRCTPEETAAILVPLDPIRVAHDKFFAEVFEALRPLADITPTHVRNEYFGSPNQPWFRFEVSDTVFTVGPRKRVVNIDVRFPGEGPEPDLSGIRALAMRDNVTSSWGSKGGFIHAWGKYRLVEYLATLIGIAKARASKNTTV